MIHTSFSFLSFPSLEIMKEDNIRLKKQLEEMEGERNQAIHERNGLKQQCTAAIRQVGVGQVQKVTNCCVPPPLDRWV